MAVRFAPSSSRVQEVDVPKGKQIVHAPRRNWDKETAPFAPGVLRVLLPFVLCKRVFSSEFELTIWTLQVRELRPTCLSMLSLSFMVKACSQQFTPSPIRPKKTQLQAHAINLTPYPYVHASFVSDMFLTVVVEQSCPSLSSFATAQSRRPNWKNNHQ